jgi:hypothetical protein
MTMKVLVYPGRFLTACTVAVAVFTTTVVLPVRSDVLELKDGTVLNGLYMGGSQSSMRFRVKDDIQVIPIEKILALTVTGRSTASAGSTLAPPPPAKATELPVGTRLLVKLMESIDTRKNKAGSRFTTSLEGKLMVDGQGMVAAASKVLKGAAIGGLASGSSGAKDGAKIGLGVAILGGGKHAGISSGTLLEFHLAEALKL